MAGHRATLAAALLALVGLVATPAGAAKGTATVPGAPTITGFTQAKHRVTLVFTAPANNGGAAIRLYKATCAPAGSRERHFAYARHSPITVEGLAEHRPYRCAVAASNQVGIGPQSLPIALNINNGTTCSTASGTTTFAPALPKLPDQATVDSVLTMTGTLGGCTGGGVTSATMTVVSLPIMGANCMALVLGLTTPITATATIAWNTNATSTVELEIQQLKGKPTQLSVMGTTTAGLFKGLHASAVIGLLLPQGACTTADLSTMTYRQLAIWSFV